MGRVRHFRAENKERKGISSAIMICITVIVKKIKTKKTNGKYLVINLII